MPVYMPHEGASRALSTPSHFDPSDDLSVPSPGSEPLLPDSGGLCGSPSPTNRDHVPADGDPTIGCTLAAYAADRRLPVRFLQSLGVTEITHCGQPVLRVPFRAATGEEVAIRFRCALRRGQEDLRHQWRKGAKPSLYGLSRLDSARCRGYVILVQSESDAQTLWCHGEPAVAIPTRETWREHWAEYLANIPVVYLLAELDASGPQIPQWLTTSALRERVRLVTLAGAHDVSALHIQDPAAFMHRWEPAKASALPWQQLDLERTAQLQTSDWEACKGLARTRRILDRVEATVSRRLTGESRNVKILFLALVSRLFNRPVSAVVKGGSSAGKSFLIFQVLGLFPGESYIVRTAVSAKALAHSQEPISHRFLVVLEANALTGEFEYMLRTLLSEGYIAHEHTARTAEGFETRVARRDGPTGLLMTTTSLELHGENETRFFSLPMTETPEQTAAVMEAIAREHTGWEDADELAREREEFHALARWLAAGETRVVVPFAVQLARLIPPVAVRLRRDFKALLALIEAHALLHRETRERDQRGRIIATLEDYEVIKDLIMELFSDGVGVAVSPLIRETVEAVRALGAGSEGPFTYDDVAAYLGRHRSTGKLRVDKAIEHGYLVNRTTDKYQAADITLGKPLPAEVEMLPSLAGLEAAVRLDGCTPTEEVPLAPEAQGAPVLWVLLSARNRAVRRKQKRERERDFPQASRHRRRAIRHGA